MPRWLRNSSQHVGRKYYQFYTTLPKNIEKGQLNFCAAAAKSLQSCLPLCDPIDGSPPGSAVPGILQAKTLEWVATISFSSAWKWKVKVKSPSRVRVFATPWTAAYQVPPSMGFSRQEYWSGVPLNFCDVSIIPKVKPDTGITRKLQSNIPHEYKYIWPEKLHMKKTTWWFGLQITEK